MFVISHLSKSLGKNNVQQDVNSSLIIAQHCSLLDIVLMVPDKICVAAQENLSEIFDFFYYTLQYSGNYRLSFNMFLFCKLQKTMQKTHDTWENIYLKPQSISLFCGTGALWSFWKSVSDYTLNCSDFLFYCVSSSPLDQNLTLTVWNVTHSWQALRNLYADSLLHNICLTGSLAIADSPCKANIIT